MVRNPKVSVDPIRVSKRLAEAKSVINSNPIVAVEGVHKKSPKVAGSEGYTRKTEIIPKIADEPTRAKKIKAVNQPSQNKRGKRPFASKVPQTDTSYKTLYFDSQKKGNMKNEAAFSNTMRVTDADVNISKGTAPNAPSLNLNHLG